jgi:membrane protease YdiL (CAAX protease family)
MTNIVHQAESEPIASPIRRFVAFPLILMVIGCISVLAAAFATARAYDLLGFPSNTPGRALGALVTAVAVVLGFKAYKRWVERAPDHELALVGALPELASGITIGALLFSIMTGIVALLGGFEVLGVRGAGQIWMMLGMAVFSGTFEEVLFRGLLLRHLEKLTGTWIALLLTSALFGLGHIVNPDATWFAAFAIAVEAGLLLGAAYLFTRRLWLAIGIHAAWNFTQGWVFSVPVSGGEAPLGLLITRRIGPDWLTGGAFGLEASVVAMTIASLAGAALLALAVRRGGVVQPMWRR